MWNLSRTLVLVFLGGTWWTTAAFAVEPRSVARTTIPQGPTRSALLSVSGGAAAGELKPPAALYEGAVTAGANKAAGSFGKIFKLGVVSGCHIGFGAYLAITVGGSCPGIAASNPGLQKMM